MCSIKGIVLCKKTSFRRHNVIDEVIESRRRPDTRIISLRSNLAENRGRGCKGKIYVSRPVSIHTNLVPGVVYLVSCLNAYKRVRPLLEGLENYIFQLCKFASFTADYRTFVDTITLTSTQIRVCINTGEQGTANITRHNGRDILYSDVAHWDPYSAVALGKAK